MTESAGPPPRPEDAAAGETVPVDVNQPPPVSSGRSAPSPSAVPSSTPSSTLSKDQYTHTTGSSPSSTAVIPAVQDPPLPTSTTPTYGWRRPEIPATTEAPRSDPAKATHAERSRGLPDHATSLKLVRIDPWSVTRHAFALSVALMIVAVVAAAVLWIMLALSGVWTSINSSMGSVLADGSGTFDIKDYLGFGRMIGGAIVLSAINVVFMTALATIGAHLYNLVAAALGGVEVTLDDN